MINSIKGIEGMEIVRILKGTHWATIAWGGQQSQGAISGCLMVHSSFGTWGHDWVNLGQGFESFLQGAGYDSLMGKLTGERREFDYHASLASWKRHLVMARRTRNLTEEQLREVWDATCFGAECGAELFAHRLVEGRPLEMRDHPLWSEPASYVVCRPSERAQGFWREIWPMFVSHLRQLQAKGVANEALAA